MFEKFSPIYAVSEKIGRLSVGTILLRHIESANKMLPLGEGVGLEKIEEPAGIADVAMAVLQNEIDRRFVRPLRFAGELQFRGDIGRRKSKAGSKAHTIFAIESRSPRSCSLNINLSIVVISDDDREAQLHMTGDQAIELHGQGVNPVGRPFPELFCALKQVDRMDMTEAGGLQKCAPITIQRTPLVGRAQVSGHHADRRRFVSAALIPNTR